MFDPVTEDYIKDIPHLNGIDEERLPLELTKIYSNIVSVKSQLDRGKLQLTEQNYLEYLQFLDKLIVGLEVLLFQSRYLSHRKNIAFVIATAYKLKSMFIDKEDEKCDVNLPQFGIKKKVRNLVVSNIFRIFVVVNQIVTNNIKRLPNDYQGQSYRNILYYR